MQMLGAWTRIRIVWQNKRSMTCTGVGRRNDMICAEPTLCYINHRRSTV